MIYRSRERIVLDMLNVAKEGARRTELMYGANLSYTQLKRYLTAMMKAELLEEIHTEELKPVYRVTDEGKKFVEDSTLILGKMKTIEEEMEKNKNSKMNR